MCHNIGDGHISGLPLLLQLPLSSWDPAGRSRDKPKVLCLGFQCHLMFTWDQHAPKVLLWLVPCRALWHLPVAIPPSQGLFASCSLQPHHLPLSLQLCLLTFPSAAFPCTQKQRLPCFLFPCLQPVQLPAATTVTSGWLVLIQRACSHHCWWFTGFGGPCKWTEAITAASWNSPLGLHHRVCTSVSPSQVHCEFLCAPEVSVLTAGAVVASSIWLFYLAVCIYQAHRGWEGLRNLVSMAGFYSPSAWLKKYLFQLAHGVWCLHLLFPSRCNLRNTGGAVRLWRGGKAFWNSSFAQLKNTLSPFGHCRKLNVLNSHFPCTQPLSMARLYHKGDKTASLFLYIPPSCFWAVFLRKLGSVLTITFFPSFPRCSWASDLFLPRLEDTKLSPCISQERGEAY